MNREVKDAVREKHQSWYRLKKGKSRSNYLRSYKKLKNIIKKARNVFLSKNQHGFVPRKSCVTNLIETLDSKKQSC